jgi:hypothetical protein
VREYERIEWKIRDSRFEIPVSGFKNGMHCADGACGHFRLEFSVWNRFFLKTLSRPSFGRIEFHG